MKATGAKEAIELVDKQADQMVKVSKRTAAALRIGIEQGNAAHAAVQTAELALKQAKQTLQVITGTNQAYVAALIEDGGCRLEDFAAFGIWEDEGVSYIRAMSPTGE